MKTLKLLRTLLLFLLAFNFVSCDNDDEGVNISQLSGQWAVTVPALDYDAVERYIFDTKNQTCEACLSGPAVDSFVRNYVYVIDKENMQITLTDKEHGITEKYEILSLSDNKMKWKNLMLESHETDKELVKEK